MKLGDKQDKTVSPLTTESVLGASSIGKSSAVEGSPQTVVEVLGSIYDLLSKIQSYEKLQSELELTDYQLAYIDEQDRNKKIIRALRGRKRKPGYGLANRTGPAEPAPPTKNVPPTTTTKTPPTQGPSAQAPATPAKAPPAQAPSAPAKAPPAQAPSAPAPTATKAPPAQAPAPTAAPAPAPKPTMATPSAARVTAGAGAAAATGLSGRASQVAIALASLGITSKAAVGAIVATSAKESGLDPFKPEDGAKPWLNTLNGKPKVVNGKTLSPLEYIYTKFPQLAPGGRVAKQLNMPDGVSEDYIRQTMAKGDEAWFTLVYPGGADAYKYRGRGLIQITGKGVYKAVGDIIGVDLEKDPDAITRDFDTAARATGAYLMNSLGRGDSKKGLAALNALTDEKEALKMVIANVARGGAGSDKEKIDKMFDPSTNLGKTTASQLEAAGKYSQLGSDAASGDKINSASTENKNLKADAAANQDKPAITVNNNKTSTTSSSSSGTSGESDDTNAYQRKLKG